jgi:hypothetical protein
MAEREENGFSEATTIKRVRFNAKPAAETGHRKRSFFARGLICDVVLCGE